MWNAWKIVLAVLILAGCYGFIRLLMSEADDKSREIREHKAADRAEKVAPLLKEWKNLAGGLGSAVAWGHSRSKAVFRYYYLSEKLIELGAITRDQVQSW